MYEYMIEARLHPQVRDDGVRPLWEGRMAET